MFTREGIKCLQKTVWTVLERFEFENHGQEIENVVDGKIKFYMGLEPIADDDEVAIG